MDCDGEIAVGQAVGIARTRSEAVEDLLDGTVVQRHRRVAEEPGEGERVGAEEPGGWAGERGELLAVEGEAVGVQ